MIKIRLHAYLMENLGDDLMVHLLLKRYPQCMFFSEAISNTDCFRQYPNFLSKEMILEKYRFVNHFLNFITRYRKIHFFVDWLFEKKARNALCSVLIGGSMFIQQSLSAALIDEVLANENRKLQSGPLFVMGVNFGPYQTDYFLNQYKSFFQKCRAVTFRDQTSYNLFSTLPNVTLAPDVVFNYPISQISEKETDNSVVISVIDVSRKDRIKQYTEVYEQFIVDLSARLYQEGKRPELVSFCREEGDETAIDRIGSKLEKKGISVGTCFYNGDADQILHKFQQAEKIFASRFHAMILAVHMQKPVFAFAYNDKISNVMDDMGSDAYCHIKDLQNTNVDAVLEKMAVVDGSQQYKMAAEKQFEQLDLFLRELEAGAEEM